MLNECNKPQSRPIGNWTVWSLYDGYLEIDQSLLFDVESSIVSMQVHGYLIDTGESLILVDSGCGFQLGKSTGFLTENLRKTGHNLKHISTILITHLHLDHMGGLLKEDGSLVFPDATIYVSEKEARYWLDPTQETMAHESNLLCFPIARKLLKEYESKKQLRFIQPGEIFPGVTAIEAFGHTPGHMGFLFSSQNKHLLLWGDLVHNSSIQFAKPELLVKVDTDPEQAVDSRKCLFKKAAQEHLLIGGSHLPFSGFGRVSHQNGVFTWNPEKY